MSVRRQSLSTPLGRLTLTAQDDALTALEWGGWGADHSTVLDAAVTQLHLYFAGELTQFDLPLAPQTSGLQTMVQNAMRAIPYGETRTYGDLARALGAPAQAVGQACGGNPLPILIPCHRVLGATGLGGYSGVGGIETKVALLRLEGAAGLLI